MKIGILCSHPFAFSSIQLCSSMGTLAGIGAPQKDQLIPILKPFSHQAFVPFLIINDDNGKSLKEWLDAVMPDTVFVLGFPYKIPETILSIPEFGFFNFHTGLLPAYPGIDPVFWQIRNGESRGGITVHLMGSGFDSGPVAHINPIEILPDETYGLHLQRLSATAAEAAAQMTKKLTSGSLKLEDQRVEEANSLKRPGFEELLIRWDSQSSGSIKALVQASNPAYGGAGTYYKGVYLRITQVSIQDKEAPPGSKPGTVVSVDNGLYILCSDGKSVQIDIVYSDAGLFSGDRLISAFSIKEGDVFTDTQLL